MSLGLQNWLKYALTVSLAVMPLAGLNAYAACEDRILDACQNANQAVDTQQYNEMALDSSGTHNGVQNHSQAWNHAGENRSFAADKCAKAADQCKDRCTTKEETKKCEKAVADQANQMKEQSAADTGQGSGMGMIAGMLGAAAGIAAAMIAQKKNEKPPPPPTPVATGALQLNGSLNCQMQDSYQYADCATFLTNYCGAQAQAATTAAATGTPTTSTPTGTIISMPNGGLPATPDCASFNAGYCSSTVTPPVPYGMQRTDGAVTQVNYAGTGAGLGTQYCARTVAASWCSSPGRSMCPSCQQQDVYNSVGCQANPALCLTQTSPQNIAAATTNAACAGDPLYTPGSPYAIAGTGSSASGSALPAGVVPVAVTGTTTGGIAVPVAGGTPTATGGTGLPVAILPTSVNSGGGKGFGVASASNGGVREGQAPGGARSAAGGANGGGGYSVASLKTGSAHAHANANELIAAGGVIVAGGPTAPSRGPASDVVPQFGPSLFTTSSAVIRQHCESGKLNCP